MSEPRVLDELGSEKSRSRESTQTEAHGEFGVTCKDEARGAATRRESSARFLGCILWKREGILSDYGGIKETEAGSSLDSGVVCELS